MIRRETSEGWLLISQVDHARLAGDFAAAWGNEGLAGLPLADWLVAAVRDHDEGWRNWEASPTVTAEGLPRGFTEMPAEEATAIWRVSIEVCASGPPSSAEALRRFRRSNAEVTSADAAVLEAILRHRGSIDADRLIAEVVTAAAIPAEDARASLAALARSGAIVPLSVVVGGPAFAINLPAAGGSPLGGVWVSKHFCALAELAKESRADRPDELAVLDRFLAEQAGKQAGWAATATDFAGDELERVLDTGFRYVRFFDRISLWLCMAERGGSIEIPLSSSLTLSFAPRPSGEIAVSPWPFSTKVVELAVPAVRVPRGPFESGVALQDALACAPRATIDWVLAPAGGRNRISHA